MLSYNAHNVFIKGIFEYICRYLREPLYYIQVVVILVSSVEENWFGEISGDETLHFSVMASRLKNPARGSNYQRSYRK